MIRVYVAGKYNDTDILKCLNNIRKGQKMALRLLMHGYAPFCPFLDYQLFLHLNDEEEVPMQTIKDFSMEWLRGCDAVLLLDNWQKSEGAKAEVAEAERLGIPVFEDMWKMHEFFRTMGKI